MSDIDAPAAAQPPMFAALFDGNDAEIRIRLKELGIDPERIRQLPQWNSASGASSVPRPRDDERTTAEEVLRDALRRAAAAPLGAATVGLFTHFVCEQEWELSYHYLPIFTTLRAMRSVWESCRDLVPSPGDAAAMDAVCSMLVLLGHELTAESQMCVGELERFRSAAEQARRAASAVIEAAEQIPAYPQFAGHLVQHGNNRRRYYELVEFAARAGRGFLAGELSRADLDRAIAKLRGGDQDELLKENDRSEVRAHRLSLEAMLARADEPWLRIEYGKILYVYPFGLRESGSLGYHQADFAVIVDRVRAEASGWELAGTVVDHVEPELRLDSMWAAQPLESHLESTGDGRGTRLAGASIVLPGVEIWDADGTLLTRLDASIIVSDLGNHHLRFDGELVGATPQQVQFALLRAAPEHGAARVRFEGGQRVWPRLGELAADLIRAVHRRVDGGGNSFVLSAQAGMYHVVVSVHVASTTNGPAGTQRTPVGSAAEAIAAMGGAILLSPVRNAVTSLAEWTKHYAASATIVPGVGFVTDVVARTSNTTVLIMPGTPDWHIDTYRSIAEFVASLGGLASSWFDELNSQLTMIRSITRQIDPEDRAGSWAIANFAHRLRTKQARLQNFVAEARSLQLLFRSPVLVESPLDAEVLRKLLAAAQFDRVEEDFAARAHELLDDRLNVWLDDIAARQEQKRRAALEIVLALVTAAGVSGVVQVFEGGPSVGWSTLQSAAVAVSVLVGAVMMVACAYFVGARSKDR